MSNEPLSRHLATISPVLAACRRRNRRETAAYLAAVLFPLGGGEIQRANLRAVQRVTSQRHLAAGLPTRARERDACGEPLHCQSLPENLAWLSHFSHLLLSPYMREKLSTTALLFARGFRTGWTGPKTPHPLGPGNAVWNSG